MTERLKNKKLFLLDMDGTLYLGNKLFPEAMPFLENIKRRGGRYMFLTNNSSKSAVAYIEKLKGLGIEATKDDFLTSVNATVEYLLKNHKNDRIYLMGTQSFVEEIKGAGLDAVTEYTEGIKVFVAAYDTELTYKKLVDACLILDEGAEFIATNPDWVCPTEKGSVPDCGSFCEMLKRATGRTPKFIGKPEVYMPLLALKMTGVRAEDAVIVGDRLYTDVACGVNSGIDSVFVLSGEGTVKDIEEFGINPTYICKSVGEIFN